MAEKPTIPDFPALPDFGQMITQACEVVASVRGIPYDFNGTLSLENKFVVLFKTVKEMFDAQDALVKSYKELYEFVNTYFDNLDVQEEVNKKIQSMSDDGSLLDLIAPTIETNTSSWLKKNITNPSNPPIDKSLTVENSAADAKTVGDKFTEIHNEEIKKFHVYDDRFLTTEYGDANTVPLYSMITYSYTDGYKNLPINNAGILLTISTFNRLITVSQEFFEFNSNNLWYRTYSHSKWKEWELTVKNSITIQPSGLSFYKPAEAPYNDFNNLTHNRIYSYNGQENLINAPYKDFNGIVYSLSNFPTTNESQISVQHAISFNSAIEFVRIWAVKWSPWKVVNPDDAIFTVGQNQKFTDPITCFRSIEEYDFHKKVIIQPGEYDIYELMGGHEFFSNFTPDQDPYVVQPWLNNIEIIGVGNVIFKMDIPSDIPKSTTWIFSPLNIRGNATIKNITIKGTNIRYCIHDESKDLFPYTERIYENVTCDIDDHAAIGCGYSKGTKITLINCNLHSENGSAYSYHSKGGIFFHAQNCIFSSNSPDDSVVRFSEENSALTDHVTLSNCYLSGNSSIEMRGEWEYTPNVGHTDITLLNTKTENINNKYTSNTKPVIYYNTNTGEKNTIIPANA